MKINYLTALVKDPYTTNKVVQAKLPGRAEEYALLDAVRPAFPDDIDSRWAELEGVGSVQVVRYTEGGTVYINYFLPDKSTT